MALYFFPNWIENARERQNWKFCMKSAMLLDSCISSFDWFSISVGSGCDSCRSQLTASVCLPKMMSLGCSLSIKALSCLATAKRLQLFSSFDQDGTVCTNSHGSSQCVWALGNAAGNRDDLSHNALFFKSHGFFYRDFVKRVHAQLTLAISTPVFSD